ncbi:MAG: MFS transporter [Planctomycetia bacterium]|nr:MFS transporter [Planctomycetia bacterium]
MIYPLLPQFLITVLGGNKFHLGIIEGAADSAASLLKLYSGAWSDRAGRRKPFVLFGYALAAIARPAIGLAFAPWHLFFARVGDRVGKGVRTSPRDALIAESTPPAIRGRAFGFHRAMDHLGAAVGPLLALAFLAIWPDRLRTLFLLALVPGIAVLVLLLVGLRERKPSGSPREKLRLTLKPFDRRFRLYLVAMLLFTLGNSSDLFLLQRSGELGVPAALLPLLWFVFHVVKSLGNLLAGRLVDRIGPRVPLLAGWIIYGGTYIGFALASAAWQAWALFLLYGVFYSLSEPAEKTFVTRLAGPEHKGLAFGWYNYAIGVTAFPASAIFGALYEAWGPLASFGWGAGLALLAAIVLLFAVRRPSPSKS